MTAILNAAIRAAETVCLVPPDGGAPTIEERVMCAAAGKRALHAMFDAAERDPAAIDAMANALWSDPRVTILWDDIQEAEKICWRDDALRALRALKAHVLGE